MANYGTAQDRALVEMIAGLASTMEGAPDLSGDLVRAVTSSMPATLLLLDAEHRILWINRISPGRALGDILGTSLVDYATPADRDEMRATFARVLRTGQPDRVVGYGPGKRGPRSRYENWVAPIERQGTPIALAVITRDVSEEWELYEALRDREHRLSLVLDAAGMGTWRLDMQTRVLEFDERARAIYGLPDGRVDALAFTTTKIHPDDRAAADQAARAAMTERRSYASENRVFGPEGQVRWVAITGSPVIDEQGHIVALLGTVMDITIRREHEARARQTQRLEAVGQLTAGIAHNFNNVLAAIMPTLAIVEREVKPTSIPLVRRTAEATSRAAELVQQLLFFAGRSRPNARTRETASTLVERTLQLCRPTFGHGIALEIELAEGLPEVLVDPGQLEQALLNLLLNARDAVEGVRDPTVTIRATAASDEGAAIVITVEDNGPGVADEARERLFDPFFTTKDLGRGTGLGLSTAYAIAREHGGSLRYEPAPRGGACFSLVIPAASGEPTTASSTARVVLVVDDDEAVRTAVMAVLADDGYRVRSAEHGAQAIAAFATPPAIDAVLLDLNMPGTSWREVVEVIRRTSATTRVVAFTGGVTTPSELVDGWLTKPAGPEAILDAIGRALAKGS
ncbi:MAG: ATP-binding protein [Proteobacteria bacterium]|nr:ATP-binding protein [Pseudomonadota bacterium]